MSTMSQEAIHEAAHAVIAKHLGATVDEIHFGGRQSRVKFTPGPKGLSIVAHAAIAYAGCAAEKRVNPHADTERSCLHDLQQFNKYLAGATPATKAKVEKWASSLVAQNWADILRLAAHMRAGLQAHHAQKVNEA